MRAKVRYKREILKLQRSLFTSDGIDDVLIYNEDRTTTALLPLDGTNLEEVFGEEPKVYYLADVPQADGHFIKLIKQMPEQPW